MQTIEISGNDAGQRLDRFLRKVLLNVPLSHIYRGLRTGKIKLNRKRAHAESILSENDRVDLYFVSGEIAEKGNLDTAALRETKFFEDNFHILFEDKDLLCLNKPAGIAVHPGTKRKQGQTLIDLVQSYAVSAKDTTFRPSLVHRLDVETSGVILVAKTGRALRNLTAQIRERKVDKIYVALVSGQMRRNEGEYSQSLIRVADSERGGKVRIALPTEQGDQAITRYKVIEKLPEFTLLSVSIETGRTHQIRVHLASDSHPIAGDRDYGDDTLNRVLEKKTGLRRQFLHAEQMRFHHPVSGEEVLIRAPLPRDLEQCLTILRKEKGQE